MRRILHREALVATLVKVAPTERAVLAMKLAHMAVAQPVHPAAQVLDPADRNDQMPVIAHKTIAPKFDRKFFHGLGQQVTKQHEILPAPKQPLALIAAVEHVKETVQRRSPRNPWHSFLLPRPDSFGQRKDACPLFSPFLPFSCPPVPFSLCPLFSCPLFSTPFSPLPSVVSLTNSIGRSIMPCTIEPVFTAR